MADKREKHYVIEFENLIKEWDWDKNNELGLYPDNLTTGSDKKVWWKCKNNHNYYSSISHKFSGRGCPYCANKKILIGYNDLQTRYPSIAKEWDYEKNKQLLPSEFVGGSYKKVWWICPKGHSYQMSILDRTQGNNCPVCAGKQVISGVNDLTTTHPKLIEEWNWKKNDELGLYPNTITYGSTKKVWWKCNKCGYEWEATPNGRTSSKTGCPCCARKIIVKGVNDLQTLFPDVAKKWHPTKNDKKPWEVAPFSNKEAYFICDQDSRHVFKTRIHLVASGKTICPICSNQKIIVGVNDFQTTNPELMKEWNWGKNNELKIYPTNITKGVNRKVWWKCSKCGYEWKATVGSRAGEQHCGCPECKKDLSSSFPEKAIAFYLSKIFNIDENKKFKWLGNSELDIYIDDLKLGVEYDGKVWHKNVSKDIVKDNLCEQNGIFLIRVRENSCPIYDSSSHKIYREGFKNNDLTACVNKLFEFISKKYNIKMEMHADVDKDYIKILSKIANGKKDKSIASTYLVDSWDYEKNGKIFPESISLGSHKKVFWKCKNGHSWMATPYSRYSLKTGCPYCAGQKVLSGENDLETLYPNIAKEWDYSKNQKKPNQIRPMDNRKYWWICSKCGKSYQSSPSHRVGRNSSCPDCSRLKTIASHYKKVVNIEQDIVYNSIKEASIQTGVSAGSISNCCRGVNKTAGGYHWKFID